MVIEMIYRNADGSETVKRIKANKETEDMLKRLKESWKDFPWCECGEKSTFGSYPSDGECDCGVYKHHVHCGRCGQISQVG